jgi:hypothetical protein
MSGPNQANMHAAAAITRISDDGTSTHHGVPEDEACRTRT